MDSVGIVGGFWLLSAVTVGAALAVFLARNLIHAVMFLVVAFLGMAGLFVTLSADFLALAPVLISARARPVRVVFSC